MIALPILLATVSFFVAPDGKDANPGTLEQPFATLERARDAVLAARPANPPDTSYVVEIRGGKYFLLRPFSLVKQDSGTKEQPVVYRAYRKEKPVFYGGERVKDFQPDPEMPGTFVADLTPLHMQNVPLGALFRLLPDGTVERLTRARYPNVDPADPIRSGWATASGGPVPEADDVRGNARKRFILAEDDLREWKTPGDGFVNVFTRNPWWNDLCKVAAVAKDTRPVTLATDCSRAIQPGDRYFLEGLREELDTPGEWHFDMAAAKIYLRPPTGVAIGAVTVLIPQGRALVSFSHTVEYVTLQGLTFRAAEGSAIILHYSKNCTIAGCTIEQCGDYYGVGIVTGQASGNLITGCDISFTGSHGIVVEGGDVMKQQLPAAPNRVVNNVIHHPGVAYKQGAGISTVGNGNEVICNFVHDCPRMGIMAGGNFNLIERNIVRRSNRETQDSAGIYLAGRDLLAGRGTIVRENLLDDTGGLRRDPDGTWVERQGTAGILLDTHASGVDVIGNVIVRAASSGIRMENGRANRIVDNVLCDSGSAPAVEVMAWPSDDPRWQRDIAEMGWMHDKVVALPSWQKLRALDMSAQDCLAKYGTTSIGNITERNTVLSGLPESLALDGRGLGPYQDDLRATWPLEEPLFPLPVSPAPPTATPSGGPP